jgi:hypothetical protein
MKKLEDVLALSHERKPPARLTMSCMINCLYVSSVSIMRGISPTDSLGIAAIKADSI